MVPGIKISVAKSLNFSFHAKLARQHHRLAEVNFVVC